MNFLERHVSTKVGNTVLKYAFMLHTGVLNASCNTSPYQKLNSYLALS
jgi:hypothetical protein